MYQADESGGHSPWHHPTFFFSRKRRQFYSLDDALYALTKGAGGGAITDGFRLRAPCTVVTVGRWYHDGLVGVHVRVDPKNPSGDRLLEIDLGWLEAHLAPSGLSSDQKDKEAKAKEVRESLGRRQAVNILKWSALLPGWLFCRIVLS